jgi:hypothetical protein
MYTRTLDAHGAAALIGAVVVLGFVAIGGRRALVQAQTEAPGVLAGIRLSMASMVGAFISAGLNGLLYYSETDCRRGASDVAVPAMCQLTRVSVVVLVAAGLSYLAGVFVWPLWKGPLPLQVVRVVLGLTIIFAAYSFVVAGLV